MAEEKGEKGMETIEVEEELRVLEARIEHITGMFHRTYLSHTHTPCWVVGKKERARVLG